MALIVVIPIILFPAAFVWYLNIGGIYAAIKEARARKAVNVLLALSLMLYTASVAIYFVGSFTWLYLVLANLLSGVLIYSFRLVISTSSRDSWRLYKLSAFPYLGLIFLVMCLDIWLLSG